METKQKPGAGIRTADPMEMKHDLETLADGLAGQAATIGETQHRVRDLEDEAAIARHTERRVASLEQRLASVVAQSNANALELSLIRQASKSLPPKAPETDPAPADVAGPGPDNGVA